MTYYDLALDDSVLVTDYTIAALQEIDMVFNTEHTEVLGDPSFGCNFEQFLWNLNPDTSGLKQYVESKLKDCYYLSKFNYTVDVKENTADVIKNLSNGDVLYNADDTYIIVIDLYGNDTNLAGKRYTTKIIQF